MLERDRGWTGLCIEPLPDIVAVLRGSRRCMCVHACIGNREEAGFEFVAVDSGAVHTRMLSDALSEYDLRQLVRVDAELQQAGGPTHVIHVPMRHLHGLLREDGIGHVDYLLSIHAEESELPIVRSTILAAMGHPCVTVENNYDGPRLTT